MYATWRMNRPKCFVLKKRVKIVRKFNGEIFVDLPKHKCHRGLYSYPALEIKIKWLAQLVSKYEKCTRPQCIHYVVAGWVLTKMYPTDRICTRLWQVGEWNLKGCLYPLIWIHISSFQVNRYMDKLVSLFGKSLSITKHNILFLPTNSIVCFGGVCFFVE